MQGVIKMSKWFDVIVLVFYCAFIYWLSSHETLPKLHLFFSFQDKIYHATAYFVMGVLTWRCVRKQQKMRFIIPIPFLLSVVFCSLYGISDEWHQSFVAGRSSDVFDWLADTIGASLAMLTIYMFKLNSTENHH
jgi:VanZ family protein